MATNTVTENVVFGYAGGSDSPAYSKDLMTNVVSTYLGLVNYTGTTASWPISNAHGDTVGVTDVNATFVANAPTDEYGRGVAPADRLGWLGAHYRFNIGGTQNLTRMGVRLYDPNLGRFLQVDPIEGGNANDYEYCSADPINCFDLDGQWGWSSVTKFVKKTVKKRWVRMAVSGLGAAALCAGTGGLGCMILAGAGVGAGLGATNAGVNGGSLLRGAGIGAVEGAIAGLIVGSGQGKELKFSRNFRIAPGGNRGPGRYEWPHYHRRYPGDGGSIKHHRPWQGW